VLYESNVFSHGTVAAFGGTTVAAQMQHMLCMYVVCDRQAPGAGLTKQGLCVQW
jgi:hypothetical protein